jgi:endonuclease YncB( thermonuclease family)
MAFKIHAGANAVVALALASNNESPRPAHMPVAQSTSVASLSRSDIAVVDGDTIQLRGEANGIRLVGFNTPETYKPVCRAGLDLGRWATAKLKQMVDQAAPRGHALRGKVCASPRPSCSISLRKWSLRQAGGAAKIVMSFAAALRR